MIGLIDRTQHNYNKYYKTTKGGKKLQRRRDMLLQWYNNTHEEKGCEGKVGKREEEEG